MVTATRTQNRYDHRLRELVRTTQDVSCAVQCGVPRSTARGWLTSHPAEVVSLDSLDMDATELQHEVIRLRARIRKLVALLRVLFVVLRISRFTLNQTRLPDGNDKRSLLRVIDQARLVLPLRSVLHVVRLSSSRYHNWRREDQCALDDSSSCPRVSPHQLTATEVETIRDLATSQEYRHVPTGTLALLAQRLAKVFASTSTWYRLIRNHQWRRPRQRVHPAKPKIGIRASHPNEIWHIDTTLIRLLDGSRAYLHAVIDNFSRRILVWKVASTVRNLVAFYVREHNSHLPHSAFRGQTPDEMYLKTGDDIPAKLEAARQKARQARKEANRTLECETCTLLPASLN